MGSEFLACVWPFHVPFMRCVAEGVKSWLWLTCFYVSMAVLLEIYSLFIYKTCIVQILQYVLICQHEINWIKKYSLEESFETFTDSFLTLSRRRSISYRNQSIDLLCKSMDWFLYDIGLRRERVKTHLDSNVTLTKGSMMNHADIERARVSVLENKDLHSLKSQGEWETSAAEFQKSLLSVSAHINFRSIKIKYNFVRISFREKTFCVLLKKWKKAN